MSEEIHCSSESERTTLPIEKGFPIERVNEIAAKEGRAKMHYRPIYTMHKWWARRLGCVFRTICLYSLLDDPEKVSVHEPGENGSLSDFGAGASEIQELIETVDVADPEALWELYPKDVRIDDKKILDLFMGGGTSLVEASRFGVESVGYDLNPVAWFVTKKELEAGQTDVEELEAAFEQVKDDVADEILQYYKTPCPNDDHDADVMYNFWVKELDCTSCGETVPLYRDFRVAKGRYENSEKYNVLCLECESVILVDDWQSECSCDECGHGFTPKDGNIDYGDYICPDCGQKYPVTDAVEEQDGFDLRLYAVEYYCPHCEANGTEKSAVKGYKTACERDYALFESAKTEWEKSDELRQYAPDKDIRPGWSTDANQFEGSMSGNGNLPRHGYHKWTDMFNDRQLLLICKLMESIDDIEDQDIKEFLLLTLSDALRTNCAMVSYDPTRNGIGDLFRTNRLNSPLYPTENNIWGTEFGRGTFTSSFDMVRSGVEYANAPTDRYVEDGETQETPEFAMPVGQNTSIAQGDTRLIDAEDEYDYVITDPPYYNNVLYSELSDYFYVWQKPLLESTYDCFESEHTPRDESIVVNPASGKGSEEFESELNEAFSAIRQALKENGALVFTYHHSDSESWGELLEALCDTGFEVTATYPVSADISKFIEGKSVEFDIVIVARPAGERNPISWNSLRRDIYRTAQKTRKRLEENRDLSRGDIGVVEMGRCFHEYSKHHGKVERAGETMSAKEVVDEIYGVIQHGSDIGEIDVFLDLLETPGASYDDLNKLCRGTNATPERMDDMRLYRMDDGFTLGMWDDEKRIAYIQERVGNDEELTDLDKAQFLRYRWEHGKSVTEYLGEWEITDDLRELCEGLADATGDDTYRNILESRLSDY
jgi:adenine-specific DNA methylase